MVTIRDQSVHEVLRQMPYGLYIVGARASDGAMNAFAASWVTQVSFEPPLVLVAIRDDSSSNELVQEGRVFSLNLIDKNDEEIVRMLEKPAHFVGDKLGKVGHVEEDTGAPILRRAFAYLECRVREIYQPGDHTLVVGEVINAGKRHAGRSIMCTDLNWHYGG